MNSSRTPLSVLTGIALIVLPLIALAVKWVSFGWMMVFLMFGPVLILLAGYALQIVIAAQGFLSQREPLWIARARTRATIAAWTTSVAVVLVGIFMPDGGDSTYGSTFQVWLSGGEASGGSAALHAATDDLTAIVALIAAVVWVGAFVWLFVEWVTGLAGRRARRRAVLGLG
jgi:hypothetical protein